MHVQKEIAANELSKNIPPSAGLVAVYLVTDDAKAYKKEFKDESKKKVAKYAQTQKDMMNAFMSMTPESRKALLRLQMTQQQDMFKNMPPDQLQQFQKEMQGTGK